VYTHTYRKEHMFNRLRHSSRFAAGALGFLTTLAVAFFIGTYLGEGTHSGTVGSGGSGTQTLPIKVSFPDGELTPTKPVTLTAALNNTTSRTVTFKRLTFAVTTGAAGCDASWFEVKPVAIGSPEAAELNWWEEILAGKITGTLNYAPGERAVVTSVNSATALQLRMKDTGASQAACEGASITVTGKLS
jgi:hypothetical protein